MKTGLKRILAGSALSGILLVSASAWCMGHKGGHDPDRMLAHMTEKLELNDNQRLQIETVLDEGRDAVQSDRERMEEIRTQLKAMRADFDEGEARRLAAELGEIASRLAYGLASTQAEVYRVLTPAQREEMDELNAMREKRMQKRRPGGE